MGGSVGVPAGGGERSLGEREREREREEEGEGEEERGRGRGRMVVMEVESLPGPW